MQTSRTEHSSKSHIVGSRPRPARGERVLDSLLQQRAREASANEPTYASEIIPLDPKTQRDRRKAAGVLQYQELVADAGPSAKTYLGTLTLAKEQWNPGMIGTFTRNLRKDLKRQGITLRMVWSMECGDDKGRWHYHFALVMPKGTSMTRERIRRHWPHGFEHMRKHDLARGADAAGYVAKYVAKAAIDHHGKKLPKGARITGCVGLTTEAQDRVRHSKLPWDIRKETTPADRVMPAKGGGRTSRATGQHWPSKWSFHFAGGTPYLRRKTLPYEQQLRLAAQTTAEHKTVRTHAPQLGRRPRPRISGGPTLSAPRTHVAPCTPDHRRPIALRL